MDKILNLFSVGWIKWIAIVSVFVGYTILIYNQGIKSEKVNTLKLENKYQKETIELAELQFNLLNENIKALHDASLMFQNNQKKTNTIVKEINNNTVKEIEKPIYNECKVSKEYFDNINKSIQQLNKE